MEKIRKLALPLALALITLLLTACGAQSPDAPAQGDSPVTITLCHPGIKTHSWQRACEYMQELLDESGSNITLDVYPSNQIASGSKLIEYVQLGTLDCAGGTQMTMSSFIDEMDVLSLPMLFDSRAECFALVDGEVGAYMDELAQAKGFKILCWWENGNRDITNSKHPIYTPEDLKGLSIRIPESTVYQKTFEALGALPTALASSDIYTGLQTGIVNGQENATDYNWDQKYYEVQHYYTKSDIMSSMMCVVMNLDKFQSLTPAQQEALLDAAQKGAEYQREQSAQDVAAVEEKLTTVDVEINEITDRDAWWQAVQGVYDEYRQQYGDFMDMIESEKAAYRAASEGGAA